jgi:hypothetical protein
MASPTDQEVLDQLKANVKLLDEIYIVGNAAANNVITLCDSIVAILEHDWFAQHAISVKNFRSRFSGIFSDLPRAIMDPVIYAWGKNINSNKTDTSSIIDDIYDWMHTAGYAIKKRNFTRATLAANATNKGDGLLLRLTTDKRGYPIEDERKAYIIKAYCAYDRFTGSKEGNETFYIITTGSPQVDEIDTAIGESTVYQCQAIFGTNGNLLTDGTFSGWNTTTSEFTSWYAGELTGAETWTNITQSTAVYFKATSGTKTIATPTGTGDSAVFSANRVMTQLLSKSFSVTEPYMAGVWIEASAATNTNTVAVYLGDQFATVTFPIAYGNGTFVNGNAVVTVITTTANLKPGDSIWLTADGAANAGTILTVDSPTQVTLTAVYAGAGGAGAMSHVYTQWHFLYNIDYYYDFIPATGDIAFQIKTTAGAGTIYFDDAQLQKGTRALGGYYWIISGATSFVKDDYFGGTDTGGISGKIQYWTNYIYGKQFPCAVAAIGDGTHDFTDPA